MVRHVRDAFVSVGSSSSEYLRYGNATSPRHFLLLLLARVGVSEMRVKILVEELDGLFGEVAALATRVQKAARQKARSLALPGTQ